jgi:hypothetical protein
METVMVVGMKGAFRSQHPLGSLEHVEVITLLLNLRWKRVIYVEATT